MHKVKSHKSVEQIAKKHRLEVSFVKKQLEMGIPIEHEHTKDKDLATDIALQHLDEIPDYYTRLKKMEADAKKHHKKFKDVKEETDGKSAKDSGYSLKDWFKGGGWVQAGGKYDGKPCAKQPGQTTKPFCRDPDDRAAMTKKERNRRATKKRREDPNPNRSGAAKIVSKEEYIQEKKGEKDACYHKVKSRYKIWPSAYASGALVKCRKVGADSWGTKSEEIQMQRYCPKCQKNETREECKYGPKYWEMFSTPISLSSDSYDPNRPHPANEEKDHEHSMARSEISTIISAAKRLKKKMKGEGNIEAWVQSKITKAADYIDTAADYLESGEHKVESVSIEDSNGNHYAEFIDIIKAEPLKPSKGIGSRLLGEESKKCWKGYKKTGTQEIFGKRYNRCVKKEEYSDWRKELFEQGNYTMPSASQSGAYSGGIKGRSYKVGDTIPASATKPKQKLNSSKIHAAGETYGKKVFEDWQSVNRKDKTDGLSPAAVKAYRRENPGSKLQTAVTEKNPKGKRADRRSNFCSRMSGMKDKLTSAKTARDPDSRINKALRRWRCN